MNREEYLRRLAELQRVGLASEGIPPLGAGFLPDPESEWNMLDASADGHSGQFWWVHDFGLQMLEEDTERFDYAIRSFEAMRAGRGQAVRRSRLRMALSLTLFLPLMLILLLFRFGSYPGSMYTLGQVIVGIGAAVAIPGAVIGLLTQRWWLLAVSVYWWTGAKVIESEAVHRGLYIR